MCGPWGDGGGAGSTLLLLTAAACCCPLLLLPWAAAALCGELLYGGVVPRQLLLAGRPTPRRPPLHRTGGVGSKVGGGVEEPTLDVYPQGK